MTILDRIVEDTREHVARCKKEIPHEALEDRPLFSASTLSLATALRQDNLAIIAELKKASPSKGLIRDDFNIADLALQYEENGAAAISILTEPLHFQGSLNYLEQARGSVALPLLRKDFIVDPYQLIEAKAYGADAVLLITSVLDKGELYDLHELASELGLSCLVEVYDQSELEKIDFDQVSILGVNNRDLKTFTVDINHSLRVFEHAPANTIRVSESGLRTAEDLAHLRQHGIDAVLIGETFMRTPNPGETLAALQTQSSRLVQAA